jgi:hypothetical protein
MQGFKLFDQTVFPGKVCPGFLLLLLVTGMSQAVTTTYTDRSVWTINGTDVYTEDFEGFSTDTSFATMPLDVGPFSFKTNGTAASWRNIVDVRPFLFDGTPSSFGNVAVDVFIDRALTASIIFDNAISGFFSDFLYAGNTSELTLTLYMLGGGSENYQVPGRGDAFSPFGFWSSNKTITSIEFSNSLNDGFYIDNVSLSPSSSAPVVPVPAAVWLFATALIGLAGFGKHRKAESN